MLYNPLDQRPTTLFILLAPKLFLNMSHIVFHSVLEIVRILVNAMPSHHLHPHILKSVVQELLIDILWLAPGALKALDELIVVWGMVEAWEE